MGSRRLFGLIFSLCLFSFIASAQNTIRLQGIPSAVARELKLDSAIANASDDINAIASAIQAEMIGHGYLSASVDSIGEQSIYFYCPQTKTEWATIRADRSSAGYIAESGVRINRWEGDPFSPSEVAQVFTDILNHQEQNGYPFSRVRFDSIEQTNEGIKALIHLQPGPYIEIDSIIIRGDVSLPPTLLYRAIEIKPHTPFNQLRFEQIERNIQELPFIKLVNPPEVVFSRDGNWLYIDIEEQNASAIDAFVGLQSNPPGSSSQTSIFGQVDLSLVHLLDVGETFQLHWERFQSNGQELKASGAFPILFKSSFGLTGDLYIFRQDTLFASFDRSISLLYHPNFRSKIEMGYNRFSSQGLSDAATDSLSQTGQVEHSTAQLIWNSSSLDDRVNPKRGVQWRSKINLGERQVVRSDSSTENSIARAELKLQSFISIRPTFTIRTSVQGGAIFSENLLTNEHFRLGGLHTMRGFDQQSIYASEYGIVTIEPRLIIDQKSNLFIFAEAGYFNSDIELLQMGLLTAFGAGINLGSNNSLFNLTWAVGQFANSGLNFSGSKIHLGFVSYF